MRAALRVATHAVYAGARAPRGPHAVAALVAFYTQPRHEVAYMVLETMFNKYIQIILYIVTILIRTAL